MRYIANKQDFGEAVRVALEVGFEKLLSAPGLYWEIMTADKVELR